MVSLSQPDIKSAGKLLESNEEVWIGPHRKQSRGMHGPRESITTWVIRRRSVLRAQVATCLRNASWIRAESSKQPRRRS